MVQTHAHKLYHNIVLISTYWNVNFKKEKTNIKKNIVLISTYWNVNNLVVIISLISDSFNLNLLECKC